MDVAVIGLGKLGSPMAAIFAASGHSVIGVDRVESTVEKINNLEPPVFEPQLAETLQRARGRLRATSDLAEAVRRSRIIFVIVPTPSDKRDAFSMDFAEIAAMEIGDALQGSDQPHLVVLTSTVMPGDTERVFIPALESASGRKVGKGLGVCYSPEFIALGSCIRDFLHPDLVLIGESDPESGQLLEEFYETVHVNDPSVARMAIVNAEVTKISLNSFVTMKISFANMIASICERFPQGNVDAVTSALGADSRIGAKYFKGSVSFGGPCFPRDNRALTRLGKDLGLETHLPHATDLVNDQPLERVLQLVEALDGKAKTIGILGLSYKPETNVIERSFGIALAEALNRRRHAVVAHDFHALEASRRVLPDEIALTDSLEKCCRRADILILALPSSGYRALDPDWFTGPGARKVLIDCWRFVDRDRLLGRAEVIALGTGDVHKLAPQTAIRHPLGIAV